MRWQTPVFAAVSLNTVLARSTHAQLTDHTGRTAIRVAVGVPVPVGDFRTNFASGSQFSIQILYAPRELKRLALRGEAGISRFTGRGTVIGRSALDATGSLLWRVDAAHDEAIRRAYIVAGLGYSHFVATSTVPESFGGMTTSAGVGTEFRLLGRKVFSELRFVQMHSSPVMRWIPIMIGTEF